MALHTLDTAATQQTAAATIDGQLPRPGVGSSLGPLLLVVRDMAVLAIAVVAAYIYEMRGGFIPGSGDTPPLWLPSSLGALSFLAIVASGTYGVSARGESWREWIRVAGSVSFIFMFVLFLAEVVVQERLDSSFVATAWAATVGMVFVSQAATAQVMRFLSARGVGSRYVLIIGSPESALPVAQRLERKNSRYRVLGLISIGDNGSGATGSLRTLGDLSTLPQLLENAVNCDILVAVPPSHYPEVRRALHANLPAGTTVRLALDAWFGDEVIREVHRVGSLSTVRLSSREFSWGYETMKRGLDLLIAPLALLLASPVMALIAIAIKLDSRGPVFFKQTRVGRDGRLFGMYKFRSMRVDAEAMLAQLQQQNEAQGAIFKIKNDPRITRVGQVIRKLSLDELPQLFNVLNGTMSVVGPRPPLPREVREYEPRHLKRLEGVPGITGLWQVKRGSDHSFEEMVELDIEYLQRWSLKMDVWIILKTIPAAVTGRGAY